MPPCERCGTGVRSGRGKGWCSNVACREAEKKEKQEEKEAAKCLREEERQRKGAAGKRGPCPGTGGRREDPAVQAGKRARQEQREEVQAAKKVRQEEKRLRQEEREETGAGERGPCPGEGSGGRPADLEEVKAEKLEAWGACIRINESHVGSEAALFS